MNGSPARFLSEQISAENFRLRNSHAKYSSDFHVAGDPTPVSYTHLTLPTICSV